MKRVLFVVGCILFVTAIAAQPTFLPAEVRSVDMSTLVPKPRGPIYGTFILPERPDTPGKLRVPGTDLERQTKCGDGYCIQGLFRNDRAVFLPTTELKIYRKEGFRLARQIKKIEAHGRYISFFLLESEYSGGAHSNNGIECKTIDAKTGAEMNISSLVSKKDIFHAERQLHWLLKGNPDAKAVLKIDPSLRRGFRITGVKKGQLEIALCAASGTWGDGILYEADLPFLARRYKHQR